MKDKKKLINRINETKNSKRIIQEWMVEENNKMREENILRTAKEDGRIEGISLGREEGISLGREEGRLYNIPISMDI